MESYLLLVRCAIQHVNIPAFETSFYMFYKESRFSTKTQSSQDNNYSISLGFVTSISNSGLVHVLQENSTQELTIV